MSKHRKAREQAGGNRDVQGQRRSRGQWPLLVLGVIVIGAVLLLTSRNPSLTPPPRPTSHSSLTRPQPGGKWVQRAVAITNEFHAVFTPCWEGAYGAIGDAYLFAVSQDSSLLRFYMVDHPLTGMCSGRWVDDAAWVCLAEESWWRFTGKTNLSLVVDAIRRYGEARGEGRLSRHEGFWSWYNWPPSSGTQERIFTNSNMNEMVSVACWLYEATGEQRYLDDALLVWNGDSNASGVEKVYYRGNGKWEGKGGLAAFGNPLPWEGAGYCSIGASLFRVTRDPKYKKIAVATAKRLMDPATGWVDPVDFYQIGMDGNGAFVNFILDAYQLAPNELGDIPGKVEKMLDHVWSNAGGKATVTLHRVSDHGIRNGWNPSGGEHGYGVGEVGTVHAQGEAVRAFGLFAYVEGTLQKQDTTASASGDPHLR